MNILSSKKIRLAVALALLVACLIGWQLYRSTHQPSALDAPMQKALEGVSKVTTYNQYVETQTSFSDRSLKIAGTYYVNNTDKQYTSHSSTTLFISGSALGHTFTHDDVTIGDDVYFKVFTTDPALKNSIKSNPDWTHFKNGTIPAELAQIAIVGPLQDNLLILSNKGKYLTFVKNDGLQTFKSQSLLRYTFTLSKDASKVPDGPLNAVVGRLTPKGTVDVWIDPTNFEVRYLLFQNAPYYSTTTITDINKPAIVTPPPTAGS